MYRAQSALGAGLFAAAIADWAKLLGREPREDDLEPLAWDSYRRGQGPERGRCRRRASATCAWRRARC